MRVLTYNIREGGAGRLQELAAVIRPQDPDIVVLAEASDPDNAAVLAERLGLRLVIGEANNGFHLACLSRLPVVRWENHRLPTLAKTLLEVEVRLRRSRVTVFSTHLASSHDGWHAVDEVPSVLSVLRESAGGPHVLAGDLNALGPGDPVGQPPAGESLRGDAVDGSARRTVGLILEAGYVDCYRTAHPAKPGFTYRSAAPFLRLDYVFSSPELAVGLRGCDVVATARTRAASDHFPVWADFAE